MLKARAAIVLLTVVLTALTAIGMEMMPVSTPPAGNHARTVMHEGHHGDAQPDDSEHRHGQNDCSYCQLAKATDLPSSPGPVPVQFRLVPGSLGMRATACQLPACPLPRWPRAPPKPEVA